MFTIYMLAQVHCKTERGYSHLRMNVHKRGKEWNKREECMLALYGACTDFCEPVFGSFSPFLSLESFLNAYSYNNNTWCLLRENGTHNGMK